MKTVRVMMPTILAVISIIILVTISGAILKKAYDADVREMRSDKKTGQMVELLDWSLFHANRKTILVYTFCNKERGDLIYSISEGGIAVIPGGCKSN